MGSSPISGVFQTFLHPDLILLKSIQFLNLLYIRSNDIDKSEFVIVSTSTIILGAQTEIIFPRFVTKMF